MHSEQTTLSVSGFDNQAALFRESGLDYRLSPEPSKSQRIRYWDTFDWRLFRNTLTLTRKGRRWELQRLDDGEIVAADTAPAVAFAWDFRPGELRDALTPLIEMRALLPCANAALETQPHRVLNSELKTIARLHWLVLSVKNGEQQELVRLESLRGYLDEYNEIHSAIEKLPGVAPSAPLFETVVKMTGGIQPGSYTGKMQLTLLPEMDGREAACHIFSHLLETIRANEQGVLGDIDTEFLHDFRVAIRRTRSGLSQIRGVFPPADVERFKNAFADLQRETNDLRDLDVYLLDAEKYRQLLPEALRPHIAPAFERLRKERRKALRKVRRAINAPAYAQLLKTWQTYLHHPPAPGPETPGAKMPVRALAMQRIYKRYRRVLKDGKKIDAASPDEALHQLRIDCKKLRYLLEFFEGLFPPKEMKRLIKQLKRLQENLGRFNDYCVQIDALLEWLDIFATAPGQVRTAAAIGSLIGTLNERKRQMRADFRKTFERFATPENRTRYKQLFTANPESNP